MPMTRNTAPALPRVPNLLPQSGSGERILIVDDNDTLRRMLWELLSELGYRVTGAPDAAHAVPRSFYLWTSPHSYWLLCRLFGWS